MVNNKGMVIRNKQGQFVGVVEDRVFVKQVYGHLHMLRQPAAWAIDCDVFDKAIAPMCFSIRIEDKDSGHSYICGIKTFKEKAQRINRKFGDQYYLELIHWNIK